MSVDFDPVRLGPRRRRLDPLAIGVVVVAIGLTVAVIKPWESGSTAVRPDASASPENGAASGVAQASSGVSAGPSGTGHSPTGIVVPGRLSPTWDDMRPYVTVRDAWGVDAIVDDTKTASDASVPRTYLERWSGLDRIAAATYTVDVPGQDESIVALGVTFPFDEVPQDARIWRIHTGGQLEWMDARPVAGDLAGGALVFERPGGDGSASVDWPGGEYRIDVLVDDFIGRIDVNVPGRLGPVPGPDAWPAAPGDLVAAKTIDPSVTGQGPFAVVDGVSVGLAARLGPLLDEAAEWHASIAAEGQGVGTVGVARLPRATGLGVMFTEHAVVDAVTIRRLAPDDRIDSAPAFGGVSSLHGRTPYLVFTPSGGGAWTPGVYAITASWRDPAGAHSGTWHVELRPGGAAGGPAAAAGSRSGG